MNHLEDDQIIALLEIANHVFPESTSQINGDELATLLIYCRDPGLIFSDTAAIDLRKIHEHAKLLFDKVIEMASSDETMGAYFYADETRAFAEIFMKDLRRRDEYNDQMKLEKF